MDAQDFWYSSGATGGGGGGGGDEGDAIGNSLRFRGTQNLNRTFASTSATYTFSFWTKLAAPDSWLGYLFSAGNNNPSLLKGQVTNSGLLYNQDSGGATGTISTNPLRFRDPSAWYHIVYQSDNGTHRIFINGELSSTPNAGSNNYNGTFRIGVNTDGSSAPFQGVMASWYAIDGQALEPTAFGRENDNGIWVPREVDFTPATMRFSDFCTTNTSFAAGGPVINGFDGITDTGQDATAGGAGVTTRVEFRPEPAIDIDGLTVRVFSTSGDSDLFIGEIGAAGTETTATNGGWVEVDPGTNTEISATSPLIIRRQSANGSTGWSAIEVDGEIIRNPFRWSADLTTNNAGGFEEPPGNAFNGSTAEPGAMSGNTGGVLTWAPREDVTFTDTLEVLCFAGNTRPDYIAAWDGNEVNYTHNTFVTVATGGGTINATTPLTITADVDDQASLGAVRLDGQILVDGVNNSYGANGFHLDFSDPDDLGNDSSGNGNDFTATGFNTDPVGIFSDQINNPDGWLAAPSDVTRAFDGDTTSCAQSAGDSDFFFNPDPAIDFTDGAFVMVNTGGDSSMQTNLNGDGWVDTETDGTIGSWNRIATGAGTITTLGFRRTNVNEPNLCAIAINGTADANILTDNRGINYDVMQDSPTENFATYNPLVIPPAGTRTASTESTFGNANLEFQANTTGGTDNYRPWSTLATHGVSSGSWYFEVTREYPSGDSVTANNSWIAGWSTSALPTGDPITSSTLNWSDIENFCVFDGFRGIATQYGATFQEPQTPPDNTNTGTYAQVIGYAFNFDATEDNARIFVDGDLCNTVDFDPEGLEFFPAFYQAYDMEMYVNFGQTPFVHTPPAGFESLQTQNLPTPAILNGRDHFGVLTYNGNSGGQSIGTDFVPGLIWFKCRSAANDHLLIDRVRGGTSGICSNNNASATTSDQYITDFDDGGSIVTGNATEINDNGQQQVAWYWRADDTWNSTDADITAGTRASNGRRDVAAGFSIVSFEGTGGDTIAHGLNERPELIINRDLENDQFWRVFHYRMDDGDVNWDVSDNLHLDTTDAYPPGRGAATRIDQVRDTFFRISGGTAGADQIAYCWHSVPGYSAIGSYTGNGDPDGTFIYTGFRPAFVMVKRVNADANWTIWDTTRNPTNPLGLRLQANTANDELDAVFLDVVSNGFKFRNTGAGYNTTGGEYVYWSFAENPFGGENTAPVTAR